MNFELFHIVLNYLAAFSLVSLAVSIWLHPVRGQFHKSFATLLMMLGASYWLISFAIERESDIYAQLAAVGLGASFIMSLYIIVLFRYLKFAGLTNKDTVTLRTIFYGTVVSIFLFVSHYLNKQNIFSVDFSHYSGFVTVSAVHFVSRIYFSKLEYSILSEIKRLANILIFAVATSGVLFLSGVTIISESQFYMSVGVVYTCGLIFSSLYAQVSPTQDRGLAHYLSVLGGFSNKTLPGYLKEVSNSGLFQKIDIMKPAEVEYLDCQDVYSLLIPGVIYSLNSVEDRLDQGDPAKANMSGLLAAQSILRSKDAHALVRVGKGEFILVAAQQPLSSLYTFQALLTHLSQSLEWFVRVEKRHDNVIPLVVPHNLDSI